MGYITGDEIYDHRPGLVVSKLFRAYGLYNSFFGAVLRFLLKFQSSFELMGYITEFKTLHNSPVILFQSSFELMGYITYALWKVHEY